MTSPTVHCTSQDGSTFTYLPCLSSTCINATCHVALSLRNSSHVPYLNTTFVTYLMSPCTSCFRSDNTLLVDMFILTHGCLDNKPNTKTANATSQNPEPNLHSKYSINGPSQHQSPHQTLLHQTPVLTAPTLPSQRCNNQDPRYKNNKSLCSFKTTTHHYLFFLRHNWSQTINRATCTNSSKHSSYNDCSQSNMKIKQQHAARQSSRMHQQQLYNKESADLEEEKWQRRSTCEMQKLRWKHW